MNVSDKGKVKKRLIKKIHDSFLWQKAKYTPQGFGREDLELLR